MSKMSAVAVLVTGSLLGGGGLYAQSALYEPVNCDRVQLEMDRAMNLATAGTIHPSAYGFYKGAGGALWTLCKVGIKGLPQTDAERMIDEMGRNVIIMNDMFEGIKKAEEK